MTKEELKFILEKGEGYFFEFKEKLDKSFAKEMVAFANASGGHIILGVNDGNKITGIEISNKLKSQIQDIARNIKPSINLTLHDIGNVLIVKISEGIDKPYHCSDGFYLRMGSNSQKMDRNQIIEFLQYEGKVKFEEQFHRHFDFDKHYSSSKLNGFLKLAGITKNLDDITILENLGVVKNIGNKQKLINAGILFFSTNLDILIEQATVTCAIFDGNERIKILNRKDFTDDIITNIDSALHFVKQGLKVEYKMTGEARRQEIYEIPLQAVREAIVNAVAHRDYYASGAHTTIEIFDNRLEIGNPGGLPKGLSSDTFGKKAVRRNPIITNLLQRCDFVENMGTGINKIKQLCFKKNIPEPEFIFNDFFTIIFKRKILNEGLNEGLNLLYKIIDKNEGKRSIELAEIINKPQKTVERWLANLKSQNKILYKGSKKTGGYFLTEK